MHDSLSFDIPQLHGALLASNQDFVQVRGGVYQPSCGETLLKSNHALELYTNMSTKDGS